MGWKSNVGDTRSQQQRGRDAIKSVLLRFPAGKKISRRYRDRQFEKVVGAGLDPKGVFTHHFNTNRWENDESVSGPGSTLETTEKVRMQLPPLLERLEVHTILDAPCGDYNWFRLIPRSDVSYIGGDIVEPLIQRNQELYTTATHAS